MTKKYIITIDGKNVFKDNRSFCSKAYANRRMNDLAIIIANPSEMVIKEIDSPDIFALQSKLLAEQEKVKKLVKRLVETESYIDDRYVKDRINETLEEVEGA